MAITLRTVKGSTLTYTEVDTNFSSLFYSASVSSDTISLFYTSSGLNPAPNPVTLTIAAKSLWTASLDGRISRLGRVDVTGSFTNGLDNNPLGIYSHAQGRLTVSSGSYSHTQGLSTVASGSYAHAEGGSTIAEGTYSHAEGLGTLAQGVGSHAEGDNAIALQNFSHAEGADTEAQGIASHAEGGSAVASGDYSHAEGLGSIASGQAAHAEGSSAQAIGAYSHAEGISTLTNAAGSHAEGYGSETRANYSHAEGFNTVASGLYQHVQGQYNISSSAQAAFIVGNGTSDSTRSNLIFASGSQVDVTGSLKISGSLTINNLISITPRSTTPGTPQQGMVIVSGSGVDQHIYCFLNTTWKQLD